MDNEIIVCACNSVDHQVVLSVIDDETGEGYLTIHLNSRPFFQRLFYGIAYIFGKKSRFGAFEEFVISAETAEKFRQGLSKIKM